MTFYKKYFQDSIVSHCSSAFGIIIFFRTELTFLKDVFSQPHLIPAIARFKIKMIEMILREKTDVFSGHMSHLFFRLFLFLVFFFPITSRIFSGWRHFEITHTPPLEAVYVRLVSFDLRDTFCVSRATHCVRSKRFVARGRMPPSVRQKEQNEPARARGKKKKRKTETEVRPRGARKDEQKIANFVFVSLFPLSLFLLSLPRFAWTRRPSSRRARRWRICGFCSANAPRRRQYVQSEKRSQRRDGRTDGRAARGAAARSQPLLRLVEEGGGEIDAGIIVDSVA